MTETRKLRVFLCHSSQDKPIVRELYQRLNAEGWIDPWLDEENLRPGYYWPGKIEEEVESADVVIVFLSNNSITKEGTVQKEIRRALDKAEEKPEDVIFIIPLRLDDCPVPRRLKVYHYQDYFTNVDLGYRRLYASLEERANELGIDVTGLIENHKKIQEEKNKAVENARIQKEVENKIRIEKEKALHDQVEERARKRKELETAFQEEMELARKDGIALVPLATYLIMMGVSSLFIEHSSLVFAIQVVLVLLTSIFVFSRRIAISSSPFAPFLIIYLISVSLLFFAPSSSEYILLGIFALSAGGSLVGWVFLPKKFSFYIYGLVAFAFAALMFVFHISGLYAVTVFILFVGLEVLTAYLVVAKEKTSREREELLINQINQGVSINVSEVKNPSSQSSSDIPEAIYQTVFGLAGIPFLIVFISVICMVSVQYTYFQVAIFILVLLSVGSVVLMLGFIPFLGPKLYENYAPNLIDLILPKIQIDPNYYWNTPSWLPSWLPTHLILGDLLFWLGNYVVWGINVFVIIGFLFAVIKEIIYKIRTRS